MNPVFLDFEASSLGKGSFPIEIGWCDAAGVGHARLIRPEPTWIEWDAASERVHGITRATLADGLSAADVAGEALAALHPGHAIVYSDAPEWDQWWLNRLLATGGVEVPVPVYSLSKLLAQECQPLRALGRPYVNTRITMLIRAVLEVHDGPRAHRAQADAERCWRMWRDVRAAVEREVSA